jgi:hypothetical protein
MWGFAGQPHRDFRLLVDRTTGDLFIADQQLSSTARPAKGTPSPSTSFA